MFIDSMIPSGRIEVVDASNPLNVRLKVLKDPNCGLMGWYHFRASGIRNRRCHYRLVNAGESRNVRLAHREEFADRWTNTGPLASYDCVNWFRIPAFYDGNEFSFEHCAESDICYYAAFAPFSQERDQALLSRSLMSPLVSVNTLGRSIEGRCIDMLTVGSDVAGQKRVWIIARQHPSETQGGFFIEGMLARLLDAADPLSRELLRRAVIRIVPNMNPDGSAHGFSRSNSAGVNLNREWLAPSQERSPEVLCVRNAMERIGVDFSMDCHADSELTHIFVCPSENVTTWHSGRRGVFEVFERAWAATSPDYGIGEPYPGGLPAQADESMCWNWVGNRFPQSLSVLLEQPFKDTRNTPVPETGWTPQRAARFGASFVNALHAVCATAW
jgi:murein tripeptide amidase MpaA